MIKAKVPHLDVKTRAKTYKAIQSVFLTMMQVLGIVTMSVGLWIFLRLKISVNCHFLNGFLAAGIFLTLSGCIAILISTVVIAMILRGKVTVRFCHYMLGFAFVLALEFVSCIYATVDHYILYNLDFQEIVHQDFAEFSSNPQKAMDCWAGLQKKFVCCGEKDPLDWLLAANSSTSSSLISKGFESCKCNKKKRNNSECTEISASQMPFNLSLTSLKIYSMPCYKSMYSFIDYQCKFLRIFGSCLMIFQLVNFFAAFGLVKKLNASNVVQTVYMVSFDSYSHSSTTDLKMFETKSAKG